MRSAVALPSRESLPALPLAAVFLVTFVAPLGVLLAISFAPATGLSALGFGNYAEFFADSYNTGVLLDTLRLGAEVTAATALLAYPLGLLYMRSGPRARAVLMFMILLPMLTSTVVRTFAWLVILGREGIVNATLIAFGLLSEPARLLYTRPALVLALAQILLPLLCLPLINSLLRIDENLLRASEGLGASRLRTFAAVILPLSLPGLVAGALLTFAGATTAFITQTLVGGGQRIYMPLMIYQQAIGVQKWAFAAALSVVFMLAVMSIVVAVNRSARPLLRGVDAA